MLIENLKVSVFSSHGVEDVSFVNVRIKGMDFLSNAAGPQWTLLSETQTNYSTMSSRHQQSLKFSLAIIVHNTHW